MADPARSSKCPACGGPVSREAYRVRTYTFRRCVACASLFVPEPPPEEAVAAIYSDSSYFANPSFGEPEAGGYHGYADYLADRAEIEAKFVDVLVVIEGEIGTGRLLDVGAGPGFLVAAADARGWDSVGIEPNGWAAAYARDEVGVDVRTARLEDTDFAPGSFDAVTLMDVIEHVHEPDDLVERARRLLRPGGVIAILTPDAGSAVSRALGARWPELQRVPEHLVLFSVRGLGALLRRHACEVVGWHSIGKRSTVGTLLADVAPTAPSVVRPAQRLAAGRGLGSRPLGVDPRTKFVIYARATAQTSSGAPHREPKLRKLPHKRDPSREASDEAVLEDLNLLASAPNLVAWMFDQFETPVGGRVLEVGAGIGTFSERLLGAGAAELLLVEPEPRSAEVLEQRFAGDGRVHVVREFLPEAPTVAAERGQFDLALCQNVLEHVGDDAAAVAALAAALRPGGRLSLLVPAHPGLYGRLDAEYGHFRRYTPDRLRMLFAAAGVTVDRLYPFNLLGVPGWLVSNRRGSGRIDARALRLYDRVVPVWRRLESWVGTPAGLSLIIHGTKDT